MLVVKWDNVIIFFFEGNYMIIYLNWNVWEYYSWRVLSIKLRFMYLSIYNKFWLVIGEIKLFIFFIENIIKLVLYENFKDIVKIYKNIINMY